MGVAGVGVAELEETTTTLEGVGFGVMTDALLVTAVGLPPFKHVHALEIFAGAFVHRAAKAGTI